MIYKKLVRDKIPEIIAEQGKKVNFRTLEGDELKKALKAKVVEEANELAKAETKEQLLDEIADLQEVITALRIAYALKFYEAEDVRVTKAYKKGRFINGYFLESTEEETEQ